MAKWHLLVSSMASVYCIMNEDQCQNVARFAIQTVSGENKHRYVNIPLDKVLLLISNQLYKSYLSLYIKFVPAVLSFGCQH